MKWLWRFIFLLFIVILIGWGLNLFEGGTVIVNLKKSAEDPFEKSETRMGSAVLNDQLDQLEALDHHRDWSLFSPALNQFVHIGMSQEEVKQALGEPDRIDPSAYGYDWWIYRDQWDQYVQVGLRNGKVNTIYTNALGWGWREWKIGMPYEAWSQIRKPETEVSFSHQLGYYTFILNKQEEKERPLFIIGERMAVQLYIDVHDQEKISGIRLMDLDTLLVQQPYTIRYIGPLPDPPQSNEQVMAAVESAYEQQIFELANVTRSKLSLKPFLWNDQVAEVARRHSADMAKNNYFDHYSPRHGDLDQRLGTRGVSFIKAGENIAWNYVDAADVHHGWMNSSGHRKNIVEPAFTHLGVGVVDKYYTQNFVQEPAP